MKNFRDELRLITNNTEWTDNEKFEAIDELHERYVAEKVKLFTIPDVSHSASKNEDWAYKDESWRNPFCQIRETATGKVIKDFGVTVHRT